MKYNLSVRSSRRAFHGLFTAGLLLVCNTSQGAENGDAALAKLAGDAVSADGAVAGAAIAQLRAAGPRGLDALFGENAQRIAAVLDGSGRELREGPEWRCLCAALDGVGRQRDDFASHLFWYTDLDAAKAVAETEGKPILSLRLLGNLDEEFSCANSRLFRTVLYANAEVSQRLREHFVLHWESVRPAPKVTIDFGDGRKLERTITGNSIHYILDPNGTVIDALPGLYAPKAFLAALTVAEETAAEELQFPPKDRPFYLKQVHRGQLNAEMVRWNQDLVKAGAGVLPLKAAAPGKASAAVADRRAVSKSAIERPLVLSVGADRDTLAKAADAAGWRKIADLHLGECVLDQNSIALAECKCASSALPAGAPAAQESGDTPLAATLANLSRSLAEDTIRNEYLLHSAIHEWFANGTAPRNLEDLNDKIYAELFLTPRSDPWLGLKPADTYSALDGDGASELLARQAAK